MKSRHKPRPGAVYREERLNELGEWVCTRMTYDDALFELWKQSYREWVRKYGETYPTGRHRYATGKILVWHSTEDRAPRKETT